MCLCVCVWAHICGDRPWSADLMRMSFFTAENDMLLMLVSVGVFVRALDGMSDLELVLTGKVSSNRPLISVCVRVCIHIAVSLAC